VKTAARPDWLSLGALQGRTVEVAQRGSGTTVQGPLLAVTPETIQVLVDGEPFVVRQQEVRKVWSEPRVGWWRVPVASLYLAVGPGLLIAVAACSSGSEAEQSTCAGRTYGITAGVIGVLASYSVARQRHDALAYDASRPVRAASSMLMLQPLLAPRAVGLRGSFSF
jgi:hypothetical protein